MSSDVKAGLIFSLCFWGAIALAGLGLVAGVVYALT